MPLTPINIQSLTQAKGSAQLINGNKFSDFVQALSNAISQYILSNAVVNTNNIVLGPGAGIQTGYLVNLVPSVMSSLMMTKAMSLSLTGRDISKLFDAVSFGVCNSLSTVMMQGTVIGGGPGTGTGRITNLNPVALENFIYIQTSAKQILGRNVRDLINCISFGVCNYIMNNVTVICTSVGSVASPPVGIITIPTTGTGRLV